MTPITPTANIASLTAVSESLASPSGAHSRGANSAVGESGFGDLVQRFIQQTNADQLQGEAAIQDLILGRTDNLQQVVLAMAQADLSFQFFMEVRNKIIESYNELMRMQF